MSQESGPPPAGTVPAGTAWARAPRLRLVALTVVLTLLAVALVPVVLGFGPPTRDELLEQAGLKGKHELLIGVKDDQPGVAQSLAGGGWRGFDIDIAYLIAGYLGFERSQVVLLPIESEDRARRQAFYRDRFVAVDLVIASYSITEEREKEGALFSAPYLHTEQSVITAATEKGPVSSLEDLQGRRVCTLTTSTSQARLREAGTRPVGRNRISECVQALYDGAVDAVTTDAAILAGFVTGRQGDNPFPATLVGPKPLRHWDIGSSPQEKWGVNAANRPLRDLVDLALHASGTDPADRSWEDAYDANLRWQQPYNLPQPVAEEQQPEPRNVEVRQWPWERFALPPPGHPGSPPAPARAPARAVPPGRGRRNSGC
ncbi:transporter substrate-binding domain-containing protein [Micromonospora sp. WMMD882]|uniref:transporter substrate-binding domain-containing protein n=1 Tax=Micromonospora sp. WMMD882 TaxID=3015151 RepID=UPI00248B8891|nr:transporter substrate-binding domain-containing protein [Micromonospora sp. WMMD882]WBB82197.1 transporter substrate-binding domain-containing protein [Micromonospora sp. WMMD882]